jgi:hypothetical protein
MALDILLIPPISDEPERVFSGGTPYDIMGTDKARGSYN